MPKITPRANGGRETITVHTQSDAKKKNIPSDWWNGDSKKEIGEKLLGTVGWLKEQQNQKLRAAAIHARMYGNQPLFGWAGSNFAKLQSKSLPMDRPTMSVVTSCIDTLVSRITQSRPRPVFLTDGADAKQRQLAKQLNNFIQGEFYQTKAYELGPKILRDACIFGPGIVKVLEDLNKRVSIERRLFTELLVDQNDSFNGEPRQMYELKLVDRAVLQEFFPKYKTLIQRAENGYVDQAEEQKSVSDLVIVAEGWHLPSGPNANDGLHVIGCDQGVIFDEPWTKAKFPFVTLNYSMPLVGIWGKGLAEQLMGTQVEINKLLMTMSKAINLVGVPRVFVEEGSKVVKAHLNNEVGSIVTYRGTKPEYEIAPCMPQEVYAQLERLVNYAYQQAGISQLAAGSKKPEGLNSGVALREYDDNQTDRFATLSRAYDTFFVDLAYQVTDKAAEIAERDGSYSTVYPNRDGTKEIDLPAAELLTKDPVIQCFDSSSLPRDPAGRKAEVVELMQAGVISPQEGRRLLDYTDIQQVDKLENAAEERILQILDDIVGEGEFTAPDNFLMSVTDQMSGQPLCMKLCTQYINLYSGTNLEEDRMQLLRDFFSQAQAIMKGVQLAQQQQQMQAQQQQMAMQGGRPQPQAVPQPRPQSPMLQQVPQQGGH
jgi:hypothetical protein